MGGKRTLRSIRKQSVPHIVAVVGDSGRVEFCRSDKRLVLREVVESSSVSPDAAAQVASLMTHRVHSHRVTPSSA
jgi:hypothetical protein